MNVKTYRSTLCLLVSLVLSAVLSYAASPHTTATIPTTPTKIRVVMDDNYPPYVFKDDSGQLKGIVVDQWNLWAQKSGIPVELTGMDWAEAQRRMQAGKFDVIDTIFRNEKREKLYEFTKPYAVIPVPIFFHNDISGISGPADVKGFRVAAKAGGNAIEVLKKNGVATIVEYPSYEKIIEAARDGKEKVFTVDRPPALYFLNKMGIAQRFHETKPLYSGEFHRAVRKGDAVLLATVEKGFAAISAPEYDRINKRWMGTGLETFPYLRYLIYGSSAVALCMLLLVIWLRVLKRSVALKTSELSESEERYRTLVNNLPIGITLIDRNYRIIMVNQAQASMFGHAAAWFKGRLCFEEFEKKEATCSHCPGTRSMETGAVVEVETEAVLDNGQRMTVHIRSVPVLDGTGESLGFIEVVEDISERKRTDQLMRTLKDVLQEQNAELKRNEELLRSRNDELQTSDEMLRIQIEEYEASQKLLKKSEEKFAALLDNTRIQLWAFDGTSYTYFNKQWFEYTGQTPDCPLTIDLWTSVIHPDDLEASGKIWAANRETKTEHDNYFRLRRHDGVYRDFYCHAVPIFDQQGVFLYFQGFNLDITKRKRAEEERRQFEQKFNQAQKMESLGVLAGGIAHDFNNILTVILGHCYLASENNIPTQNYPEIFRSIETAAQRAAQLCRQMLTYAGKSPLVQEQLNLWLLVDEVVKMLQSALKKNVTIVLDAQQRIPEIVGDSGQIQQIVMNLIINAAEAIGEENGAITVALSMETFSPAHTGTDVFGTDIKAGGYVCLEVADSGCGMDDETCRRIFEPFYTTKFTGRGLGMAAIHGIVKGHAGYLFLTSTPGTGTTFKVYFPLPEDAAHNETAPSPQASLSDEPAAGTILVVEDEVMLRTLGEDLLVMMGFSCMTAANGLEALEIYRRHAHKIDLVLLDMIMPVMGGIETYHELRSIDPNLPIIICSGYEIDSVADIVEHDAHAAFIHKPYRPEQLRELAVRAMQK